MRPRRCPAVPIVLVLVGVAGLLPAVGAVPGSTAAGGVSQTVGVDTTASSAVHVAPARDPVHGPRPTDPRIVRPTAPRTVLRIDVRADGSARWTVQSRYDLDENESVAAFRAMVADVRNGTAPAGMVGYSVETFRRFVGRVESSVGRSAMRVEDPRWEGWVENDTGVMALSFTWTNFARTDGSRVVLGDVFEADVAWFSHLEEDQRLVITPPEGYGIVDYSLSQPYDEYRVSINGSANLTAMDVSIAYEPIDVTATPTRTRAPTPTPTPTPGNVTTPGDPSGGSGLVIGGFAILLVALAAVAYVVRAGGPEDGTDDAGDPGSGAGRSGGDDDGAPAGASTADGSGVGSGASDATGDGGSGPADPTAAGTGSTGAAATSQANATDVDADADADAEGSDGEDEGEQGIDETLLSDEERVERLLERNGGRMKQANIVSETGWSNAKVSQLLSSMDEDDRIDKLRIGRENLIALPDEDVTDFE